MVDEQPNKRSSEDKIEAQREIDDKLVAEFAKTLREAGNFGSIRIFAVKQNADGSTFAVSRGSGDFYSAYGLVQLWVKSQAIEQTEK